MGEILILDELTLHAKSYNVKIITFICRLRRHHFISQIEKKHRDPVFYLSEDGLSDLLLQQSVEPLHLCGHAGRPVHMGARRMIKGPLLLRQLRHRMKKNICTTRHLPQSTESEVVKVNIESWSASHTLRGVPLHKSLL